MQRDSLLDLLARFVHLQSEEKRDDQGRKVKTETMIFPRYHQLQAVRMLVDAARREGIGHNYLIEHSAGSGKSNTIGCLTHRLASLHDAANQRVFDSVIVVTDRVVLDQQLQDTIYQFEHKRGVVQKIDENSRQLAQALGQPTHRYTMRQAIEEAFILDVLKYYTTYATYFKLLKACDNDPHVERKKAAQALARFMKLHPHNIAQKTEVMIEHFHAVTRHKIGGRAKAMVVTGSRLEAVRYKQSFDRYIQQKG